MDEYDIRAMLMYLAAIAATVVIVLLFIELWANPEYQRILEEFDKGSRG